MGSKKKNFKEGLLLLYSEAIIVCNVRQFFLRFREFYVALHEFNFKRVKTRYMLLMQWEGIRLRRHAYVKLFIELAAGM